MELIKNSLILMVLGMGFVFLFLGIQVFVTNWVSRIAAKFAYLLPEPQKAVKKPAPKKAAVQNDGELVAVVSAAIQQFNSQK